MKIILNLYTIVQDSSFSSFKRLSLNAPNGWKSEATIIKYVKVIFLCLILYETFLQVLNVILDLKMLHVYNICIDSGAEHHTLLNGIFFSLPLLITVSVTTILDLRCYFIIKNHSNVTDDLSLRTSIVSICLLFLYIIGIAFVLNFFGLNQSTKYYAVMSISIFLSIVRNPIILLVTFRVNELNRHVDEMEEREHNRQIEINFALQKREERNQLKKEQNQLQMIPTISKSIELTPIEC